jgi:hypothetical protein
VTKTAWLAEQTMKPIISGPSTERVVRAALLTLIVDGFAVAFLWDGYAGYARDNVEKLVASLGMTLSNSPAVHPELTAREGRRLASALTHPGADRQPPDSLPPASIQHGEDHYYLGPGGHLRVRIRSGQVSEASWTDGPHNETDQTVQRWIGFGLLALGLFTAVRFAAVLSTRVAVTDEGLCIGRRKAIPFAAITAVRADGSPGSGRAVVQYTLNGRRYVLRLDDYVLRDFAAVLAAICEASGRPNPMSPPAAS